MTPNTVLELTASAPLPEHSPDLALAFFHAVAQLWIVRRLDAHFMKTSLIAVLGFILIGCASSRPSASLTPEQAKALALRLANDKASAIYPRQPFHDGEPATFESGRWIWRELAPGDIEATVKLAADGSTNSVAINILSNIY